MSRSVKQLFDPRRGDQAIHVERLTFHAPFFEPVRTNYFSVFLINSGRGMCRSESASVTFEAPALLFFVPYEHLRFVTEVAVSGDWIQFHANFLCVETFHAEVGCSSVLFNDPYGSPLVPLNRKSKAEIGRLFEQIGTEHREQKLAYRDVMLSLLKVLLINATRLKSSESETCPAGTTVRHPALIEFCELIEFHYQSWHSPVDYARKMHISAKTLGRIVRDHLGTTPTNLIRNRILIHAKWQLLHTLKPVKEISRELGFMDELYFSRLFKKATGYSPTFFREFETEIRGGSNLSMSLSHSPIQPSAPLIDT